MSLDVTLYKPAKTKFMFESLEEWAQLSGYLTPAHPNWEAYKIIWGMARTRIAEDETTEEVFSANITHNLNKMADVAGIYEYLWRPDEIGVTKAAQLIKPLTEGLSKLKADPKKFEMYNAPNGWGLYEHFVPWVENYLSACIQNPDADISVSR